MDEQPAEDLESAPSLLDLLLAQTAAGPPLLADRVNGVVVGRIARVEASGAVHVTFAGSPEQGFVARLATPLTKDDEGREVALMFEDGDPRRPIAMGKLVSPLAAGQPEAAADGRRVEINAAEEIVLRCGESSITLTRAGKIVIRGAYVLSRSSGVNRIQGGSVEIN
ncbi:DUF6484 domain-containing protein [Sorangium sp. So ce1389]|uniref:DUF6484 domain-containing protein n=1 Tax=Sorangium sp. So ce1389 TaxID=3133336 RepID=UPI003F6160C5